MTAENVRPAKTSPNVLLSIIYSDGALALEGLTQHPHLVVNNSPVRVEALMAQQQLKDVHRPDRVRPVWKRISDEAEEVARREPELASFIYSSILHHDTFEQAVVHRIAERLDHPDVSGELIRQAYADALEDDPSIGDAFRADIVATIDRDPASDRFIEPVLYFKGFHAIGAHRLAH